MMNDTLEEEKKKINDLSLLLKDKVAELLKEADTHHLILKEKYEKCYQEKCKKLDLITDKVDNENIIKLDDRLDFVKDFEMEK